MKIIFLDRDETLNHDPGYLNDPNKLILKENVIEGLQLLKLAGFQFIIITNQAGIAKGLITHKQLGSVHNKLKDILSQYGLEILKIYYCPDEDDRSECRKPNPGMIQTALAEFDIDLQDSYIIGDRLTDIQTGEHFNLPGILLRQSNGLTKMKLPPKNLKHETQNLLEAAHYILTHKYKKYWEDKIYDRDQGDFLKKIESLRKNKKRIVLTNGCFDLLHSGHLQYLFQASQLGDILVVGLNSDQSVRSIKGRSRPIIDEKERAILLANFSFINMIVIFDENTPLELFKKIKPDVYVKGGDYEKEDLMGYSLLKELEAEVIILPFKKGLSTSSIIQRVMHQS